MGTPLIPQSIYTKCMLKYLSAASMAAMAYCVEVVSMREKEVPDSSFIFTVVTKCVFITSAKGPVREGGGLQNGKVRGPKTFSAPPPSRQGKFESPLSKGGNILHPPPSVWLKASAEKLHQNLFYPSFTMTKPSTPTLFSQG